MENKDELTSEINASNDNNQYIEALTKMKENSVDRSSYEKLMNENKKLLDAIINGARSEETPVKSEKEPSIQELRNKLLSTESKPISNLEFASTALKLREKVMAINDPKGIKNHDPFVPYSRKQTASPQTYIDAQIYADALQECVDEADGDSEAFVNIFNRRFK